MKKEMTDYQKVMNEQKKSELITGTIGCIIFLLIIGLLPLD